MDCSAYFAKYDKSSEEMKKYYNETYWSVFRNVMNVEIKDGKVDDAYLIKKLPKVLRDIIEIIGVRKSLSYSQYNYLKPYLKDKKFLEIGSGEGFVLELFENKGFDVFGIEPSKDNLEIITGKLKWGSCKTGFAEDLPQFDKKFDVIFMSHVLEHVIDCRDVLSKLKNGLSLDGTLFIEVPNCQNEETLQHSINTQPHLHHFTKKSLEKLMQNCGFKILKMDTFRCDVITLPQHLKYLLQWIFKADCYNPASEQFGNNLRLIVTHADK
ncbi:MAG TPA: class I SAM-dependent methyltransferase [Nitrosopumilaceae archaeon]|nr:class I SAM-dependent methyltransferase [Nitrosopumilaceae archaeon]